MIRYGVVPLLTSIVAIAGTDITSGLSWLAPVVAAALVFVLTEGDKRAKLRRGLIVLGVSYALLPTVAIVIVLFLAYI